MVSKKKPRTEEVLSVDLELSNLTDTKTKNTTKTMAQLEKLIVSAINKLISQDTSLNKVHHDSFVKNKKLHCEFVIKVKNGN